MLQSLHSGRALGRVPLAHGSHQINSVWAGIWYQLLERCSTELGEAELHLAGQFHAFWPALLCGRAHDAAYLVDLICLHTQVRHQQVAAAVALRAATCVPAHVLARHSAHVLLMSNKGREVSSSGR